MHNADIFNIIIYFVCQFRLLTVEGAKSTVKII